MQLHSHQLTRRDIVLAMLYGLLAFPVIFALLWLGLALEV